MATRRSPDQLKNCATVADLAVIHKLIADNLTAKLQDKRHPPTVGLLSVSLAFLVANSSVMPPPLDDKTRSQLEHLWAASKDAIVARVGSPHATSRDYSLALRLLQRYEESHFGRPMTPQEIAQALSARPLMPTELPFGKSDRKE